MGRDASQASFLGRGGCALVALPPTAAALDLLPAGRLLLHRASTARRGGSPSVAPAVPVWVFGRQAVRRLRLGGDDRQPRLTTGNLADDLRLDRFGELRPLPDR